MGFFKKLRSPKNIVKDSTVELPWHQMVQIDQLDAVVEESKTKPVVIFKHSTRCGISRGVLRIFERNYKMKDDQVKLYFLDLLAYRDISNEIAARFKVHHESPQLIVVKNGEVVHHTSHHSIDAEDLPKYM